MAMNFPASPAEGAVYQAPGGPKYTFTAGVWLPGSGGGGLDTVAGDARYVNVAGDIMTGELTVKVPGVVGVNIDANPDSYWGSWVNFMTNGEYRWYHGSGPEMTNGVGNYEVWGVPDAPAPARDRPDFEIWREDGWSMFRAGVECFAYQPRFIVNKTASGQDAGFIGSLNGKARWWVDVGDATPETGANSGSDFTIDRFTDAGVWIDSPITITRSNGAITFHGQPYAQGGIFLNPTTISVNQIIPAGFNGISAGPITVANNIAVVVETGATWTVV